MLKSPESWICTLMKFFSGAIEGETSRASQSWAEAMIDMTRLRRCILRHTVKFIRLRALRAVAAHIFALRSACSCFNLSISVGVAGHDIPSPSVVFGFGIIWK